MKMYDWETDCCHNKPEGSYCRPDREGPDMEDENLNHGCERMRFIVGADEIAINAEMGLYKQFEVDDDVLRFSTKPWANQMRGNMQSGLLLQVAGDHMNQSAQNKLSSTQLALVSHSTPYLKSLQPTRRALSMTSSL